MNPFILDQTRVLARHAGCLLLLAASGWIVTSALLPDHQALTLLVRANAVVGIVLAAAALRRLKGDFLIWLLPICPLEWTVRATALICLISGLISTATAGELFAAGSRLSFYLCCIAAGLQALLITYRQWAATISARPLMRSSLGFGLFIFPLLVVNTLLLPSWWLYGFDLAFPLLLGGAGLLYLERKARQLTAASPAPKPALLLAR